jgi:uncharacterized protein YpmS
MVGLVICPSCRWEQQIGGQECQRCGVIFARYKPPEERPIFQLESDEFEEIEPTGPTLLQRALKLIRWVPLAVPVLCLFLIFSLPAPPKVERDAEATASAQEKLSFAQDAIHHGATHSATFSEAELNSIVMLSLRDPAAYATEQDQKAAESIRDLRLQLKEDHIVMYVAFRLYGKMMTLTLSGKLRVENDSLRFDAESGSLGSLPLPVLVLDRAMSRLFDAPENREKFRLPRQVRDVRVEQGQLIVELSSLSSGRT